MGILPSSSDSDAQFRHMIPEVLKKGVSKGLFALDNGLYLVNSKNSELSIPDNGLGVSDAVS